MFIDKQAYKKYLGPYTNIKRIVKIIRIHTYHKKERKKKRKRKAQIHLNKLTIAK
jgi:hypothetical protein